MRFGTCGLLRRLPLHKQEPRQLLFTQLLAGTYVSSAYWPVCHSTTHNTVCMAPGMRTEYRVDKVPFFKHCEEFRMGRETVMGRRDKKSGQQRAYLREVPEGLQIDIQLDQPFPGIHPVST